ncbi:hypothetical protein V9T40_001815 [Parthenolecanium corni]|uniref:Uncharacterized protein n=1 Tax=Parthenolecanium corni TaxID=536013 RepID=A0AAN9TTD7_9HEMI
MLHYYNLLRGPKEEDEVHADIVKFRRYYNHRPCVSPSALKREANFDFQPIFNLPPSPEEPKSLPLQRIQSPVHEEYESCYFTPVASLEDCADCENKISPRNGEQRRVYVRGDGPTIDDLIKFNNSLPDKATPQKKLSPQYFQPLPYSLRMSCLVAGPDIRADSVTYSHFSDLRGTNQQLLNLPENNFSAECETSASNSCDDAEIEFEESSISGKFSQAVDKKLDSVDIGNSVNDNPTFDQSSSSLDSITEEISFSPDENFIIDESQTTGLNMRVVETSPYKIFTDSSRSSSLFSDYCNEN